MPPTVAVFGAGAIGGLVGARLHESGVNVRLVGRAPQVDAIGAKGLLVKAQDRTWLVQLPPAATLAGTPDIILLTVKSQDVRNACRTIASLHSGATVVTMQN